MLLIRFDTSHLCGSGKRKKGVSEPRNALRTTTKVASNWCNRGTSVTYNTHAGWAREREREREREKRDLKESSLRERKRFERE